MKSFCTYIATFIPTISCCTKADNMWIENTLQVQVYIQLMYSLRLCSKITLSMVLFASG